MRLPKSQCFFLIVITVSFTCGIIFQYLSPLIFYFFVFNSAFFSYFAHPKTHSTISISLIRFRLILFHYNLHLSVRFYYNTSYKKYLLNYKQSFKTKEETMGKNCYNLFKKTFFDINFLPYLDTSSILLVGIGSQVASFH